MSLPTILVKAQQSPNFYVDISSISTIGSVDSENISLTPKNLLSAGITCGNEFRSEKNFVLALEFYYYNNKLVIAEEGDDRFELHQCLGANIKPGFNYGKHTSFLISGINAVYLFDKNENTGHQIDRFDDSIFWGIEQNYQINQNFKATISYIYSKFERISFYTTSTLKNFQIIKLGLGYTIN